MKCGIGKCGKEAVGYLRMTEVLLAMVCEEHTAQVFRSALHSGAVPPWKSLPKRGQHAVQGS